MNKKVPQSPSSSDLIAMNVGVKPLAKTAKLKELSLPLWGRLGGGFCVSPKLLEMKLGFVGYMGLNGDNPNNFINPSLILSFCPKCAPVL